MAKFKKHNISCILWLPSYGRSIGVWWLHIKEFDGRKFEREMVILCFEFMKNNRGSSDNL